MNEPEFRIRPYSKRELARMYFPDSPNDNTAIRNFYNMMVRNRTLMRDLKKAGYKSHSKILRVREVRIIVKYLEEP